MSETPHSTAWLKYCEVHALDPDDAPPRETAIDFGNWFTDRLNEHPREKPFDEWLRNWKEKK